MVSKESALTGNYALTSSVYHRLAGSFCLCVYILDIEFFAYTASAEFCVLHSKQNGDPKPRI